MLKKEYPYYLANKPVMPNTDLAVIDKYSDEIAYRVALADEDAIDQGIGMAVNAAEPMRTMPAYQRQEILTHCVKRFTKRAEELAQSLCIEAGKPINDSRGEVSRLIETFKIAAEESVRMAGEYMPLDRSPRTLGYFQTSWLPGQNN
ncbi:MAG: aldehyde dehydrogenase family protein [Desulfobacteraceae bacterium]|jgi:acyl-CoA reductase-like NAD-dependent aldehyde dehydrogenase|nr:aldehyde dehydrogenase family protein [Desulfobacteraceae bacterium]